MKKILFALLLIGVVAAGVKWLPEMVKPAPQAAFVFVVEATKSVTTEARDEAFAAVERNADVLQRGDGVAVIPLTGDAATEAPGKVFRHRIRTERKAFDADLREAKKTIHEGLERLKNETAAKPFLRTDLLGTLRLAAEEKPKSGEDKFTLVVLSDMIQDTTELDFKTHPQLANEAAAKKLAISLLKNKADVWSGMRIFLGQLRSEDLKRLGPERREAIRAFWLEFFRAGGAAEVVWATDGAGQLDGFLRRDMKE